MVRAGRPVIQVRDAALYVYRRSIFAGPENHFHRKKKQYMIAVCKGRLVHKQPITAAPMRDRKSGLIGRGGSSMGNKNWPRHGRHQSWHASELPTIHEKV
jgi:hypothetical protein